jgi:hypothetical protein
LLEFVCALVNIALGTVVPEEDRLVDPSRDHERNFAIALAGCGRFEFGDALFKIRAAAAAEIRCANLRRKKRNNRGCDPNSAEFAPSSPLVPSPNPCQIPLTEGLGNSCKAYKLGGRPPVLLC